MTIMIDDLEKLASALWLVKRNRAGVNQNLALSAQVIRAMAGLLTESVPVLGHEISEIIVIANGLRMLKA